MSDRLHQDRTSTDLLSPLIVDHVDIDECVLSLVQHIAVLEGQDGGGTVIEPGKKITFTRRLGDTERRGMASTKETDEKVTEVQFFIILEKIVLHRLKQ